MGVFLRNASGSFGHRLRFFSLGRRSQLGALLVSASAGLALACVDTRETRDPAEDFDEGRADRTTDSGSASNDASSTQDGDLGVPNVQDGGTTKEASVADSGPPKATVSARLGSVELVIGDVSLLKPSTGVDFYTGIVKVSGGGLPAGTDFAIHASRTGSGCGPTPEDHQGAWLRYPAPTYSQYHSPFDATCGMTVTSLADGPGKRFEGTVDGKLNGINDVSSKSVDVKITFSIP